MEVYSYNKEDLEEAADGIKAVVMRALVKDGLLKTDEADEWCATHTIIYRRKGYFRTISDEWRKEKTLTDRFFTLVVNSNSITVETTVETVEDEEEA